VGAILSSEIRSRLRDHLAALYGRSCTAGILERLEGRLDAFCAEAVDAPSRPPLSERTAVLVTYADQVRRPGSAPLRTLGEILEAAVGDIISDVHVLPFFPYSSDDGFSVIDYRGVDPRFGTWDDVHRLARQFGLMTDLVLNHVSAQSDWFRRFLDGAEPYADFFVTVDDGAVDLASVVRPRSLPLLTRFETAVGPRRVWTTFSADQVDLNYANPEVLLRMIDLLLAYVRHGATLIRLDAVAYLWKRIGTPCIHLEETHRVIKIMRAALDAVAPDVLLITETNVPHEENVRYFGDGMDEAQLVYQFPLPPLVVDAVQRGDASDLSRWATSIGPPPGRSTFLNFLASHDGIGLRPVEGILDPAQVEAMVERTIANGGRVSYRDRVGAPPSPYELNISYFDALVRPGEAISLDLQVRRFLTAQAVMLSLAGVPAIYFHSLFGSRSWSEGPHRTGENRAINREKLGADELAAELEAPASRRHRIFSGYRHLLSARARSSAFHPHGPQRVIASPAPVFALLRWSPDGAHRVLALHNLSERPATLRIPCAEVGFPSESAATDLLTGELHVPDGASHIAIPVGPFETVWLAGDRP